MKRKLFSFLIIGFILLFGCSEKVDYQTTPETSNVRGISSNSKYYETSLSDSSIVDIVNQDGKYYIVREGECNIDSSEYHMINVTSYSHYIYKLIELLDSGYVEFMNYNQSKAFSNKLRVLVEMIDSENYIGALHKLEHDIYEKTHLWIKNQNQIQAIDLILYFTTWMIENQEVLYETDSIIVAIIIGIVAGGCINAIINGIAAKCDLCASCFDNAAKKALENDTTIEDEVKVCRESKLCSGCI